MMKNIFNKAIFSFDNILMTIASFLLLISSILAVINAVMRSVGLGGFLWSDEATVILIVVMVFLTQPFLEYTGAQLNIGFIDNFRLPDRAKTAMEIGRGIVIMILLGYLAYYCWDVIQRSIRFNIVTPVLRFPRYLLYGCLFVSFVLTVLNWLIKIIGKFGQNETVVEENDIAVACDTAGDDNDKGGIV